MVIREVTTHLPDETLLRIKDKTSNIFQLANKYGYVIEQHSNLQTPDGYLLEIHRIPHGKLNNNNEKNKPVVFLMHGLLSSSQDFLNNGPNDSLAFLAAEKGFDVWLGNARGNAFSRKHITLNPDKDKEFWDFSWHEIGIYDLPIMIDYALTKTGKKTIKYIGHSQGATILAVLISENPAYIEKIQCAVFLAPGIFFTQTPSKLIQFVSNNLKAFWPLFCLLNMKTEVSRHKFPLSLNYLRNILPNKWMMKMLNIYVGVTTNISFDKIPVILASIPGCAASKQFLHYCQLVSSKLFRKYDYGQSINLVKYGQQEAPLYDLSQFKIPTFIYVGMNDKVTSYEDCLLLKGKLPNVVDFYAIEGFNHIDFLWADDVVRLLYESIFSNFDQY